MAREKYKTPPLRGEPRTPDTLDGQRLELVRRRWRSQDSAAQLYAREIEENIRMLAGRHWDVYSPLTGGFVDVTRYMSDAEKRWRQRPVVNWLKYWFLLTHARVTENPPIIAWQPSTPDRTDALLAEAMDTIWKTLWRESEMNNKDLLAKAWVIVGGAAYFKSRADMTRGPKVMMQGAEGEPTEQREGELDVQVLNPLEVRGAWGPAPWHEKKWHIHRTYLTCEEVLETYGVEVQPNVFGAGSADMGGMLEKVLFGNGYFSSTMNQDVGGIAGGPENSAASVEGYVAVDEMWERPSKMFPSGGEKATDAPGGRLLIVCGDTVLHDSERPHNFKGASGIQEMPGVFMPGSPRPSSLMTHLVPLQKTWNRGWATILEHRNLNSNPKVLTGQGIDLDELTNAPGEVIENGLLNGLPQVAYLDPPQLAPDTWRTQDMLLRSMMMLGNMEGAQGESPTANASGELVEQLRFNSDRFISVFAKTGVECYGRVGEDWLAILPSMWTTEKTLAYTGTDQVSRVLPVLPELFDGSVNVIPDPESMLPESRGERRAQAAQLFQLGVFGDPLTDPKAKKTFLEQSRFPHLGRMARPGGVDRTTAEQAVNRILQGEPATAIALYKWYDIPTFIEVTREFIASPEYLKVPEPVQLQFAQYWELLQGTMVAQQMDAIKVQGAVQGAAAMQQAATQGAAQQMIPPSPAEEAALAQKAEQANARSGPPKDRTSSPT